MTEWYPAVPEPAENRRAVKSLGPFTFGYCLRYDLESEWGLRGDVHLGWLTLSLGRRHFTVAWS